MIRLTPTQLSQKLDFITEYKKAKNAADGSKMDANANVTQKNIATMEQELMKDFFVQINRAKVSQKIAELFGQTSIFAKSKPTRFTFTMKPALSLIAYR